MKPFVLLVEDNPDDEMLTLLAFEESRLANPVEVVRDGVEAIEFLEGTGQYAGRDASRLPQVVLLDLNLPRKNGLQVLAMDAKPRRNAPRAGCHAHHFEPGTRFAGKLPTGCQQLRAQACGLSTVPARHWATGNVLAGA